MLSIINKIMDNAMKLIHLFVDYQWYNWSIVQPLSVIYSMNHTSLLSSSSINSRPNQRKQYRWTRTRNHIDVIDGQIVIDNHIITIWSVVRFVGRTTIDDGQREEGRSGRRNGGGKDGMESIIIANGNGNWDNHTDWYDSDWLGWMGTDDGRRHGK